MNTSVWEEQLRTYGIEVSPESPWNQSHSNFIRSRSRSPERWRGEASGQLVPSFQNFAAGREVRGAVPVPQRGDHFTLQGHDFGEGIQCGGAGWPYFHCYSDSHGVRSDEIRESSYAQALLNSSNLTRLEQPRTKQIPCKFYVQGHCRHGLNCRYLHGSAPQTDMRLSAPKHGQDCGTQSMQNTQTLQPVGVNVQTQLQSLQEVTTVPYSRRVGASIYHDPTATENARIINPNLAPPDGTTPLPAGSVSKQLSWHSQDPRMVINSSSASPPNQLIQQEAVRVQPAFPVSDGQRVYTFKLGFDPSDGGRAEMLSHSVETTGNAANSVSDHAPTPVPRIQQAAVITQPAISVSSGQQVHTIKVAFDHADGHPIILSRSVELPGNAANLIVDPSESTKGEPSSSDVKVTEPHNENEEAKARRMFRTALKEFVRDQIKDTLGGGQFTEELNAIVQKSVEKVMWSERYSIPKEENIANYLSSNRNKLKKFIQDYIDKYIVS